MNTVVNKEEQAVGSPPSATETERAYIKPVVRIFETAENHVLEAEMPGVSKEGLSVSLEGNVLTLEGRRRTPILEGAELVCQESETADFRRVFELDPTIAGDRISARMEQGILTLTLPKVEATKPRKIEVA